MKRDRMEELQVPEAFRKLNRRFRRGGIIFHWLYLILSGCTGFALLVAFYDPRWIPCVIAAFILAVACRLTVLLHIRWRYVSVWEIAKNPETVYWGHATDRQGQAENVTVTNSRTIKLHLKNGRHLNLEAVRGTGISFDELREAISWLKQRNPAIRWGSYDGAGSSNTQNDIARSQS